MHLHGLRCIGGGPEGALCRRLPDGSAELAIHQISEILAVPGAVLVGPLPKEIQNYTVYAGAVSAGTTQADAAKQLIAALRAPHAAQILKAKGMEVP